MPNATLKGSIIKRLKLSLEIAVRFLFSQSRGNFLSFITGVSIVGVCVGVLALLVVTSVINGFENELTQVISGTQGDVIFYTRGSPIRDKEDIERKIREFTPDLKAISGSFVSEVMFTGPLGVAGGAIEGVDLHTWADVVSVEKRLQPGSVLPIDENEIVLGSALAERLGVTTGDSVRVILPFTGSDDEAGYGAPRVQDFKLTGIVHLGMYDYDSKYSYAPLGAVQKLVFGSEEGKSKDWITSFRIKLKPGSNAPAVSADLSQHFGFPYRSKDWSQLNKNLLYASDDGLRERKGNRHSARTRRSPAGSILSLFVCRIILWSDGHLCRSSPGLGLHFCFESHKTHSPAC